MRRLRIAMAQINTTVGDFDGNVKRFWQRLTMPAPRRLILSRCLNLLFADIRRKTCCSNLSLLKLTYIQSKKLWKHLPELPW